MIVNLDEVLSTEFLACELVVALEVLPEGDLDLNTLPGEVPPRPSVLMLVLRDIGLDLNTLLGDVPGSPSV